MSNWYFLNKMRVTEPNAHIPSWYITTAEDGFNGMFRIAHNTKLLRCIASDGLGWQHVSVSIEGEDKPPTWSMMCHIKELFWEDEDWVCQFHPAKSQYVNCHPGCLHLWRYTGGGPFQMPLPNSLLVGPKT